MTHKTQLISFIEEVPSTHLVTLFIEGQADMFLELFLSNRFLIDGLVFMGNGGVGASVSATVPTWAGLCRQYQSDEFVKMIEHHFYTKHFSGWVAEGMV